MKTTRILFVCNGNIFRSMTAEYALKQALGDDPRYSIGSAGLASAPHDIVDFVRDHLTAKGVDISRHRPSGLTAEKLREADLPIAMGIEHRDKIAARFGMRLPLFSEVAYDTVEAMLDVYEAVPDWLTNRQAAIEYGCGLMDYIFAGMPGFIERIPLFVGRIGTHDVSNGTV